MWKISPNLTLFFIPANGCYDDHVFCIMFGRKMFRLLLWFFSFLHAFNRKLFCIHDLKKTNLNSMNCVSCVFVICYWAGDAHSTSSTQYQNITDGISASRCQNQQLPSQISKLGTWEKNRAQKWDTLASSSLVVLILASKARGDGKTVLSKVPWWWCCGQRFFKHTSLLSWGRWKTDTFSQYQLTSHDEPTRLSISFLSI